MTSTLDERFNKVVDRLLDDDFLKGRGLGNEIGFYIFDYPPEQELEFRDRLPHILKDLAKKRPQLRVAHVNLFDLVIGYLRERGLLEKAIEIQTERGDEVMRARLSAPLQPERLAEAFAKQIDPQAYDLVLISGVGTVYPMLRSHSLLNNLHRIMGEKPLVMFFPGIYDGQSLSLFGRLHDENYYRAFKLIP